jgi:hypothetical protein
VADLPVNEDLVGRQVRLPNRPEWGIGKVLRVQATEVGGAKVHRVSVQFATGHRNLVVPPARLAAPEDEPQRTAGWIDKLGKQTLDDRLTALPETVADFLGTSTQRLVVLARLYEIDDDGPGLERWARSQAGVADPLSHWTRDEIRAAFDAFTSKRDRLLRETVARIRSTGGTEGLRDAWLHIPDPARQRMKDTIDPPQR